MYNLWPESVPFRDCADLNFPQYLEKIKVWTQPLFYTLTSAEDPFSKMRIWILDPGSFQQLINIIIVQEPIINIFTVQAPTVIITIQESVINNIIVQEPIINIIIVQEPFINIIIIVQEPTILLIILLSRNLLYY